ncbi:MAG: hypothetical protein ACR2PF_03135 [Rhizobiaceae bacterium]
MAGKRHKPEEIVTKLRQVEVLVGQGITRPDAVCQVSSERAAPPVRAALCKRADLLPLA